MASSPNGIYLGNGINIFAVNGDPNAAVVAAKLPGAESFVSRNSSLADAAIGSVALDYSAGRMWLKTAAVDSTHPTGTWTAK